MVFLPLMNQMKENIFLRIMEAGMGPMSISKDFHPQNKKVTHVKYPMALSLHLAQLSCFVIYTLEERHVKSVNLV